MGHSVTLSSKVRLSIYGNNPHVQMNFYTAGFTVTTMVRGSMLLPCIAPWERGAREGLRDRFCP